MSFEFFDINKEACAKDKRAISAIPQFHMIHFIVRGFGYFNGRRLGAGEGFICYRDKFTNYYQDKDEPWHYYWVNMRSDDNGELFSNLDIREDGTFIWDTTNISVLDRMMKLDFTSVKGHLLCLSEFYRLMSTIATPSPALAENHYITLAKKYISANLKNKLTAEMVARELHVSRAYLRNLFQLHLGICTQDYIISQKLERARELLEAGDYMISQVSASVGYDDHLQFSRIFKKHFGAPPTAFKKK